MFRAFDLQASLEPRSQSRYEAGFKLKEENAAKVRSTLESFLNNNGIVDASRMQSEWFPQINAQVFISHSHKDEKNALVLAGWLSELGLNAFVDSSVWGHAGDLLKLIDNVFCLNDDKQTYSYESRNGSTSHVHMLLVTALAKMIDNTECIFFLNTPNSINSKEAVDKTKSPWIFAEIAMMEMVRRRTKESHRQKTKLAERVAKHEPRASLQAEYTIDLTSFTPLSAEMLTKWRNELLRSSLPRRNALDVLYSLVP